VIIDAVMFDNEFDILECRLWELKGIVEEHLICEANSTFSGIKKPYLLTEAMKKGRFKQYPITVFRAETLVVGDTSIPELDRGWITPETRDCWWRERTQRKASESALRLLAPETRVIYGDLDEIPRRWIVESFKGPGALFAMKHLVYSTRVYHPEPWAGCAYGTVGFLGSDPSVVRDHRGGLPAIADAGWHLSWFGGPDGREGKYVRQAHQELRSGGRLAHELPNAMLHVDAGRKLEPYHGDLPSWVTDHAPESWMETFA